MKKSEESQNIKQLQKAVRILNKLDDLHSLVADWRREEATLAGCDQQRYRRPLEEEELGRSEGGLLKVILKNTEAPVGTVGNHVDAHLQAFTLRRQRTRWFWLGPSAICMSSFLGCCLRLRTSS